MPLKHSNVSPRRISEAVNTSTDISTKALAKAGRDENLQDKEISMLVARMLIRGCSFQNDGLVRSAMARAFQMLVILWFKFSRAVVDKAHRWLIWLAPRTKLGS